MDADPKYLPTKEKTNYVRLVVLLTEICTDVFRDVLDKRVQPANLASTLSHQKSNLFSLKILNYDQRRQLYPEPSGTPFKGSSKDMDLSLLYTLLRSICSIPGHSSGWGKPPTNGDDSLAANIERIRIQRNEIQGHAKKALYSDTEFEDHWKIIYDATKSIEINCLGGGTKYQHSMDMMYSTEFSPEIEKIHLDEIKKANDKEIQNRDLIKQVKNATCDIARQMEEIKKLEEKIYDNNDLGVLKKNISELKAGIEKQYFDISVRLQQIQGDIGSMSDIKQQIEGETKKLEKIEKLLSKVTADDDDFKHSITVKPEKRKKKSDTEVSQKKPRTEEKKSDTKVSHKKPRTEEKKSDTKVSQKKPRTEEKKSDTKVSQKKPKTEEKKSDTKVFQKKPRIKKKKSDTKVSQKKPTIKKKKSDTKVFQKKPRTKKKKSDTKVSQKKPRTKKKKSDTRVSQKKPRTEENKERRDQRTLTDTEKQTRKRIKNHNSSKTFVRTKAVLEGKAKLDENGVLIYIGLPGDGKTENAIDIMGIYLQDYPDKCFKILTDISEWSNVDPDTESIILLDDVLGSSNTNTNVVIREGKNNWANVYSCIKQGKVKVIFTVRKNILIKNQAELEKYPLFRKEHVVDLTLENYRLSDSEKEEIFTAHCHDKGIEIVTGWGKENHQRADQLDKNTPIRISSQTVRKIVNSNPVIGYPFACFLFFCHTKYIKQGYKFFIKPTQDLKDEISSLNDLQSTTLEKLEYCIMSYMVLRMGKIDLDNLEWSLLNEIIHPVGIQQSGRLEYDLKQASMEINHKYIIGEYPYFTFKHQTLLEAVALCLGEHNAQLLLRFCSEGFISEFIRPHNHKPTEGEVVIKLRQSDYKHLIQRIIDHLQNQITRGYYLYHDWWVCLHVMDDVQFVDLFIDNITCKSENMQIFDELTSCCRDLLDMCEYYDKAILLDKLQKHVFCNQCFMEWSF